MINAQKILIVLVHAFIGWALCAATMGVGMAVLTMGTALLVHAAAAPVFFILVSRAYFRKFHFTRPLATAMIFTGFVIVVDFFVVALLINKSLAMFGSFLGTWIPFGLIFAATYVTGMIAAKSLPKEMEA